MIFDMRITLSFCASSWLLSLSDRAVPVSDPGVCAVRFVAAVCEVCNRDEFDRGC